MPDVFMENERLFLLIICPSRNLPTNLRLFPKQGLHCRVSYGVVKGPCQVRQTVRVAVEHILW